MTTPPKPPDLRFVSLTQIPPQVIIAHMSDPRVTEHMPLGQAPWDRSTYDSFISRKLDSWSRDGLGHWAILYEGDYVGWGGFQKEGEEWDFGLVLVPERFGLGPAITRRMVAMARRDTRIPYVTFLLPPSRRHLGGLTRLGASFVGEVDYDGRTFLKFRLDTPRDG